MKTVLQNLVFQSGFKQAEFAEKVGVKVRTLKAQLKQKSTLKPAVIYANILGVNKLTGYESGCFVELEIKK